MTADRALDTKAYCVCLSVCVRVSVCVYDRVWKCVYDNVCTVRTRTHRPPSKLHILLKILTTAPPISRNTPAKTGRLRKVSLLQPMIQSPLPK